MYFYFDSQDKLRTSISHGEIPRQGSTINIYLCFDEDRFDDIYNKVSDYVLQVSFTLPDGTQTQTEHLSLSNGYLGLEVFNKLTDSEMTFDLKPGLEYHTFKKSFYSSSAISQVYGKVTMHIAFYKNEEYLYTENGTFYVERTIGNKRTTSTITPGEYEILNTLINEYIVKFEQITFVTDVESLESVTNPDTRHIYRLRNADGKLEYYNYKKDYGWHRFVTGEEFEILSEKVDSNENRVETLEETSENHSERIETLEEASEEHSGRIGTLEDTSTQHGSRIENLETTSSQHSGRIEELENTSEEQAEKIITLEEVSNQHTSKIEKNKSDIKTVSDKITTEENTRKASDENLQKNIDAESNKRESDDANLQGQITINSNNLNKKINLDFSGIGVAPSLHKDDTIVIRCNGTTYTITIEELASLINSEVDYFKGVHSSLNALYEAHPTGEPGDYAFVGGTGSNEQVVQYVWDKHENRWEETITTQYVGTSTFETFQQRLQDGSIHVGAVKGNVDDISEDAPLLINVEINGNQYALPNVALDFLGEAVEGAYKLGAIKINGDTWNVNNDIVDLEFSDENLPDGYELGSVIIGSTKWNVLKMSVVNEKIQELKNYIDANTFNKGEFLSLEALQLKYSIGKPGDFAFVNTPTDQGDIMLMYIWDDDSGVWKETTSEQYVLNSNFEQFRQEIEDRLNNFNGGGGVEFLFNAMSIDSTKIYEVPIFYDVELPLTPFESPTKIEKIYINKKLPPDFVEMLCYYALLVDGLINPETGETSNGDQYILKWYDEINDIYCDLGIFINENGIELFADVNDNITLYDSENGWHDDAPDYIEFNLDMYSYLSGFNGDQITSLLFATIMSQIFSIKPFENKEFDSVAIRKEYFHLGFNTFDQYSFAWSRVGNGNVESDFVDVKSLEYENGVPVGEKDKIYRVKNIIKTETIVENKPVPTSGILKNVFINKDMSVEDVVNILKTLTYHPTSDTSANACCVIYYAMNNNGEEIRLFAKNYNSYNTQYSIILSTNSGYSALFEWGEGVENPGWQDNTNFLNDDGSLKPELIGELFPGETVGGWNGAPIGVENDKIIDLIYTKEETHNEDYDYSYHQIKNGKWQEFGAGGPEIYADGNKLVINTKGAGSGSTGGGRTGGNGGNTETLDATIITVDSLQPAKLGATIPNTGTVENVYFNTNLTKEEVNEIINKLSWLDSTPIGGNSDLVFYPALCYLNGSAPYVLVLFKNINSGFVDMYVANFATNETVISIYKDGEWNLESSPYSVNSTVLSELMGISAGSQNDYLKNLISSTPFEINNEIDLTKIYRILEEDINGNQIASYYRVIDGVWFPVLNGESMHLSNKNLKAVLTFDIGVSDTAFYSNEKCILEEGIYFVRMEYQLGGGYFLDTGTPFTLKPLFLPGFNPIYKADIVLSYDCLAQFTNFDLSDVLEKPRLTLNQQQNSNMKVRFKIYKVSNVIS